MTHKPLKQLPPPHRPEREGTGRDDAAPQTTTAIPPSFRLPRWLLAGLTIFGLLVLVGVLAGSGLVQPVLDRIRGETTARESQPEGKEQAPYPKLLKDADGKPVVPPTIVIDDSQARILGLGPSTIVAAEAAVKPRPLPSMEGQLNYDTEYLFSIRPRFPGEVQSFAQVPVKRLEADGDSETGEHSRWKQTRDIGVGDTVQGPHFAKGKLVPGTLLAIIWSKDLGDKKAALIDALIDLHRDTEQLTKLKNGFQEGVVAESRYYEQQRTVHHDINAVNAAERTLRMWKLTDAEIHTLYQEATRIEEAFKKNEKRDPRKEKDWARVEVRAPNDGVIVEKNTNRGDWVDPSASPNPMFKIADLRHLAVWINAREEYRLTLQQLLFQGHDAGLRMEVRLLAEPGSPPLKGEILRIAPSLDPNMRTMLVIGRVENPGQKLLVGQTVTATIFRKPGPDQVQIPTTALNEQDGQCLVFVEPPGLKKSLKPNEWAFTLRRVAVTQRYQDVVLVRSKLTAEDEERSRKDVAAGRRPIEPLRPGERIITRGVTMLTSEIRDLTAEQKAAK
jgi:cobalt-zinc-cadmium efflux system membrane fusion protein